MISGSGLELSGGKLSLKDLAKGVGKAANVAIPLAQAFGVEGADQAAAVNNAIQGQGFGKGTQRKMLAAAKKGGWDVKHSFFVFTCLGCLTKKRL